MYRNKGSKLLSQKNKGSKHVTYVPLVLCCLCY